MFGYGKKTTLPQAHEALPGRAEAMSITNRHFVNGQPLLPPYPVGLQQAMFGMGCFWGAEKRFWSLHGVYITAVGYAGGYTPNPSYQEVCSGHTGHNEVVMLVFDPQQLRYVDLLSVFWQSHDPTQGMRQGNDVGTQYRSGIYVYDAEQHDQAERSRSRYQQALLEAGFGMISTEIIAAPPFFFAEDYHQQYLAKNPSGYCGLGGTGVNCPAGA